MMLGWRKPTDPAVMLWRQANAACRRNRRPAWLVDQTWIGVGSAVVFAVAMLLVYLR